MIDIAGTDISIFRIVGKWDLRVGSNPPCPTRYVHVLSPLNMLLFPNPIWGHKAFDLRFTPFSVSVSREKPQFSETSIQAPFSIKKNNAHEFPTILNAPHIFVVGQHIVARCDLDKAPGLLMEKSKRTCLHSIWALCWANTVIRWGWS